MEKLCIKWATKASPRPLLILLNNPKQPLHERNYFNNNIFWNRIIKKPKIINLFLLSNPIPFNGQDYEKQKECRTSNPSLPQVTKQVQK